MGNAVAALDARVFGRAVGEDVDHHDRSFAGAGYYADTYVIGATSLLCVLRAGALGVKEARVIIAQFGYHFRQRGVEFLV
jgi:hypothetical protein